MKKYWMIENKKIPLWLGVGDCGKSFKDVMLWLPSSIAMKFYDKKSAEMFQSYLLNANKDFIEEDFTITEHVDD